MNDAKLISELIEGDDFIGYYALKKCELKETEGMFRLVLELSDKSGHISAVVWNDAKELKEQLEKGSVVKVKGITGSYREKPQVRVEKIRPAEDGEYDLAHLLPSTPEDIETLRAQVEKFIKSIGDPFLKKLMDSVFGTQQFMNEYTRCPGGSKWHHAYLGGLLEHSVGIAYICDFIAGEHPELNRDLLVTAALLHDVGKIREYTVTTVIEYSDEGRLEGHIIMGERFVRNMCERIENFPRHLKMLMSHLMLSHQGFKAFSSPVEPMIPEGFVLYYADEIDSKLNALKRVAGRSLDEGKSWSDYVNILERFIYVGDKKETDNLNNK